MKRTDFKGSFTKNSYTDPAPCAIASIVLLTSRPLRLQPERALRRRLVVLQVEIVDLIGDLAVKSVYRYASTY